MASISLLDFFRHVCKILQIKNELATTYRQQTNSQVKRYSNTIIAGLRHYFKQHPKNRDLYSVVPRFGYNTQVHSVKNGSLFELVFSQPP